MKLEYVYNNNSNLKYTLKALSIFELAIILILSLIIYTEKNTDSLFNPIFMYKAIIRFIFLDIVVLIFMTLTNNYKRKKYISIKNQGEYCEANIVMAIHIFKHYKKLGWLCKDLGEIAVFAKNQIYKIKDIDYNNEFKILEEKTKDNLNQHLKHTDTLGNVYRKEINVGIYILGNKAVADLDSITENYKLWKA